MAGTVYCTNCGTANEQNLNFCTRCGTPLPTAQNSAQPTTPIGGQPTQQFPQQYQQPPQQQPQYPQYPQQQYPPQQYPPQYGPPYVQQYAPAPVPEPAKRRSSCGCCFGATLIFLLVIVGGAALLFFMVRNGTISQRQLLSIIGQGPSEVSVYNFTDGNVRVKLTPLDRTQSGEQPTLPEDEKTLEANDIYTFPNIPQGRFSATFTYSDGQQRGVCSFKVDGSDLYTFVAVPEGVAVTREKESARSVDDMKVDTSPLCKR